MYCTTVFYSTRVNANFVMLEGKFHEHMNKEKGKDRQESPELRRKVGTDRRVQD